jgi:hypothetical protein
LAVGAPWTTVWVSRAARELYIAAWVEEFYVYTCLVLQEEVRRVTI